MILERLERSFDHKESADLSKATIEHVLPQTLTEAWQRELGDDATEHCARLLHTLGNLTLSAYNPELSNQPYDVKRKLLIDSHIELNRHFAEVARWSPDAILERGRALAQRALKIWSDVGRVLISNERVKRAKRPSLPPPLKIRFRVALQPVVSWKDAFLKMIEQFDASSPGLLRRIATEQTLLAAIAMNGDRFPRSKVQIGDVYINTHASAATFLNWCRKVAEIGGIGSDDFEFVMPDDTSMSAE